VLFLSKTEYPISLAYVEITIGERSMRTLDQNYHWSVEPGKFTVYLGENCEKILMEADFVVE
jgi:hypothetical protein